MQQVHAKHKSFQKICEILYFSMLSEAFLGIIAIVPSHKVTLFLVTPRKHL